MADSNTTGPVWFSYYFLKGRFEEMAKKKRYNIAQFNLALQNLGSHLAAAPAPSICTMCDKPLNGQSKPVSCAQCSNSFHKTCFRKIEDSPRVPQPGWVCHDESGAVKLRTLPPPPPPRQSVRNTKRPRLEYGEVEEDPVCPIENPRSLVSSNGQEAAEV